MKRAFQVGALLAVLTVFGSSVAAQAASPTTTPSSVSYGTSLPASIAYRGPAPLSIAYGVNTPASIAYSIAYGVEAPRSIAYRPTVPQSIAYGVATGQQQLAVATAATDVWAVGASVVNELRSLLGLLATP